MDKYCITAARPQGVEHGLKSEFMLWKYEERPEGWRWVSQDWKRGAEIAVLLDVGDEVLTAQRNSRGIRLGEPVELELRIAHNGKSFKLSEMPDNADPV